MADESQLSEQEKKRRRRARMLGLLLFNPWPLLQRHIVAGSDDIYDHFDDVRDGIEDDGQSPEDAVDKAKPVHSGLSKMIAGAMLIGFADASRLTGKNPALYSNRLKMDAADRAQQVGDMMNETTVNTIKKTGTTDGHVLSRDRADAAAKFEAVGGYYHGVQQAFGGDDEFGKEWITTSNAPCEDICLENEDEGLIPMNAQFQSGHYAPLGHLNCQCYLGVRRMAG